MVLIRNAAQFLARGWLLATTWRRSLLDHCKKPPADRQQFSRTWRCCETLESSRGCIIVIKSHMECRHLVSRPVVPSSIFACLQNEKFTSLLYSIIIIPLFSVNFGSGRIVVFGDTGLQSIYVEIDPLVPWLVALNGTMDLSSGTSRFRPHRGCSNSLHKNPGRMQLMWSGTQ